MITEILVQPPWTGLERQLVLSSHYLTFISNSFKTEDSKETENACSVVDVFIPVLGVDQKKEMQHDVYASRTILLNTETVSLHQHIDLQESTCPTTQLI